MPINVFRWTLSVALATAVAVSFGDRTGFEGDDLAIIAGAAHFDMRPLGSLYRYPWQSLSYVAAHLAVQNGVLPLALTWVSHILCALGLVILAETVRGMLTITGRTWIAYGLILAVPELWITALYFNTTAIGLPFFCGALYLLHTGTGDERDRLVEAAGAGLLFAIACVCRFDFATTSIALLVMAHKRARSHKWRSVCVFASASAAAGALLLFLLRLSPLEVLKGAADLEGSNGWGSWIVLALAILPLLAMAPFLALELRRRSWPQQRMVEWLLLGCAAVPVLFPIKSLYSAKYLVPGFCLLLIVLASLLRQPLVQARGQNMRTPTRLRFETVCACCLILLITYLVGVRMDERGRPESLAVIASDFNTADGRRPFGGYLGFLQRFRDPEWRPSHVALFRRMAEWITRAPRDSVVILVEDHADPDNEHRAPLVTHWTWGWPALYLADVGWKIEAYEYLNRIAMRSPDGRLAQVLALKHAPTNEDFAGCVLVVGPIPNHAYEDLMRLSDFVGKASCGR